MFIVMSSYFFIALLLFSGRASSFLFPIFFRLANAQQHNSTGPNSFNIIFGGSDNLPGDYTVITNGSFALNIENTSELANHGLAREL
jgi:hypothetical protein